MHECGSECSVEYVNWNVNCGRSACVLNGTVTSATAFVETKRTEEVEEEKTDYVSRGDRGAHGHEKRQKILIDLHRIKSTTSTTAVAVVLNNFVLCRTSCDIDVWM